MLAAHPVPSDDPHLRDALIAASLPVEDLAEPGRVFLRFAPAGNVVGYGGYEKHGKAVLLRSVVVLPEARGEGFGRAITEGVLSQARADGCTTAYLLTTDAAPFFEHLGFRRIDRIEAPEAIRATRQATSICSSATMLVRRLDD